MSSFFGEFPRKMLRVFGVFVGISEDLKSSMASVQEPFVVSEMSNISILLFFGFIGFVTFCGKASGNHPTQISISSLSDFFIKLLL